MGNHVACHLICEHLPKRIAHPIHSPKLKFILRQNVIKHRINVLYIMHCTRMGIQLPSSLIVKIDFTLRYRKNDPTLGRQLFPALLLRHKPGPVAPSIATLKENQDILRLRIICFGHI